MNVAKFSIGGAAMGKDRATGMNANLPHAGLWLFFSGRFFFFFGCIVKVAILA